MKLHPGVPQTLRKLGMDELGIAKAIIAGELQSPQRYENISLVDMRITGTGTAYRRAVDEAVYRPPEDYLNDEFLQRCNGLPVIMEHPGSKKLDSAEFADRIVGTIFVPYIKGDEVWGISKIYDDATRNMIEEERLSTSPAVVFRDPSVNETVELEDGSTFLIEGKPSLLDHLAICEQGVWDKGGQPSGVASTIYGDSDMTDEEKRAQEQAAADAQARKDAEEQARKDAEEKRNSDLMSKLDAVLAHCDSLSKRMDAYEAGAKKDADETVAAGGAASGEGGADGGEEDEAAKLKLAAEAAEREAAARGDNGEGDRGSGGTGGGMMELDSLKQRMDSLESKLPAERSEDEEAKMADAQAKADSVFALHGAAAGRPLRGETLLSYRKRLAAQLQQHSNTWKGIDLKALPGAAFDVAEQQIFADAQQAAADPVEIGAGALREIRRADRTGRMISTFVGDPSVWMDQFRIPRRVVTRINKEV